MNELLLFYFAGLFLNLWIFTRQKLWIRNACIFQFFIACGSLISLMWILLYNSETKANGQ